MSTISLASGFAERQPYQLGLSQPGLVHPSMVQPNRVQPNLAQPNRGQPGAAQPGLQHPGFPSPGLPHHVANGALAHNPAPGGVQSDLGAAFVPQDREVPSSGNASARRTTPFRVLVVEPEREVRLALTHDFQQEGFQAEAAETAQQALFLMHQAQVDALILGLALPDRSGLELCRELRSTHATRDLPILMITAHAHEAEHILVLEAGADDYVAKPFSTRQIILRTRGVLRRAGASAMVGERLESGPLTIECAAHRVFLYGEEVSLTSTEYRLLLLLLRHPGRVFSRTELLDHVWNMPNRVVTRTVDTHVKRLRQKLRHAGSAIETVRNAGYRYGALPWQRMSAES